MSQHATRRNQRGAGDRGLVTWIWRIVVNRQQGSKRRGRLHSRIQNLIFLFIAASVLPAAENGNIGKVQTERCGICNQRIAYVLPAGAGDKCAAGPKRQVWQRAHGRRDAVRQNRRVGIAEIAATGKVACGSKSSLAGSAGKPVD